MKLKGRAWRLGDNIDTDAIIAARHLSTFDPVELAGHLLEGVDPSFRQKLHPGDVLVAGENFGCGSSREHAPLAIKAAGVSCVVAASFARIFYRNAINIGLPIVECAAASRAVEEGDELEIELAAGVIRNLARGEVYRFTGLPPFLQQIIEAGGLIGYLERRLVDGG